MKNPILILVVLGMIFLTSCSSVQEKKADGAAWQTQEQLMQYKYAKMGKVGSIPIYGYKWDVVETYNLVGYDQTPVWPNHFDCTKTMPTNPQIGDQYCNLVEAQYFLIFGENNIPFQKKYGVATLPKRYTQLKVIWEDRESLNKITPPH